MSEKLKTPEELAEREVNKKLAKAIANRQLEIKKHEAEIKKLQKEIGKIKTGELVPGIDEDENSSSSSEKVIKIIERTVDSSTISPYKYPKKKKKSDWSYYPYSYWSGTTTGYRYR